MKTPIVDFVKAYAESNTLRLHMPGHKGKSFLGVEAFDITEINGADVLGEANGIIAESEQNAANLFGTQRTFYSTEGSSLVIKTMLAMVNAVKKGERCRILAARNVHKAFVYGCALCDIDVTWLNTESYEHLCSCRVTPERLQDALKESGGEFDAVYVTSPDYLGNLQDIKGLSAVCDEWGIPLLVDNAHGAYLSFLEENQHPIGLGASMCADSAHKTLPVLTGGAYLHIAKKFTAEPQVVRNFMSVFGSTSPSYLILQSLDLCNAYILDGYREKLKHTADNVQALKQKLQNHGFKLYGDEALKLTVDCADFGICGDEVANVLRNNGIEIEFYDSRFAVMMFTPEIEACEITRLGEVLCDLKKSTSIPQKQFPKEQPKTVMSIRKAVFSSQESVPLKNAVGRICASPTVSCPPAVPVVISGETITEQTAEILKHYNITNVNVIIEKA